MSTTSWISSSPIVGGEKGRNSLRLGGAEPTVMCSSLGPGPDVGNGNAGRPRLRCKRRSRARTLRFVDRLWEKHLAATAGFRSSPAATSTLQMCVTGATVDTRAKPRSQAHGRICPWRHALRRWLPGVPAVPGLQSLRGLKAHRPPQKLDATTWLVTRRFLLINRPWRRFKLGYRPPRHPRRWATGLACSRLPAAIRC